MATSDTLTPAEAKRALYIDFEGCKDEAPVVLGILYGTGKAFDKLVFRHLILDRDFADVVGKVEFDGFDRYECAAQTTKQAVADLLNRARSRRRPIVSWSQHELTKFAEDGMTARTEKRLPEWHRDAKATAKRWANVTRYGTVQEWKSRGEGNTLVNYMRLFGLEHPPGLEGGEIGAKIRRVRSGLSHRGSWDQLLDTQRRAWTDVLAHNIVDCQMTREVALTTSVELLEWEQRAARPGPIR